MSLRGISSRTWCKDYKTLVKWNEQQVSILEEIQQSSTNITVLARAGCGKTSILTGIVGALGPGVTGNVLAFNAHIAEYLKGDKRIPNRMKVSTAHSLGLSLLRKVIEEPIIRKGKYTSILDNLMVEEHIHLEDFVKGSLDYKRSVARDVMYGIQRLLSLSRSWVIDIGSSNNILEVYDYYGFDFPISKEGLEQVCSLVSQCLHKGKEEALNKGLIDFGDMVWLPNELDLRVENYKDVVLMDEAQDTNLGMMGIVERLVGPSTRAIFMCDDKQEIYGFNGSVPGICNQINTKFSTKPMPLTYCYRCPESHLEMARKWVPDIVCGKEDKKGSITRTTFKEMERAYRPGMVVVGRFNTPLVELGVRLITKGIAVHMPNKDLTQGFISLLDSVRDMDVPQAVRVLEERRERELGRVDVSKKSGKRRFKNICDRYDGTLFLIDTLTETKPGIKGVIRFLEDLQGKPVEEGIHISTVHSFKGGEADDVVLLDSDNMPYYTLCSTEWEEDMERNVAYVAHTRSKKNLYLVNKKGSKE